MDSSILTVIALSVGLNIGGGVAWYFAVRENRRLRSAGPAPADDDRLVRVEQALEVLLIQNDRLADGQDFLARVMSDRLALPLPRESRRPGEITPH